MLWTTLPCGLEPHADRYGCRIVNDGIATATARWPNLVVVNWGGANTHKEYLLPGSIHYSDAGNDALATLLLANLDASTTTSTSSISSTTTTTTP